MIKIVIHLCHVENKQNICLQTNSGEIHIYYSTICIIRSLYTLIEITFQFKRYIQNTLKPPI